MTKEERLARSRAKLLWCVHILGPDELVAKESYAAAERYATELNDYMHGPNIPELDIMCLSLVAVWPHGAESHATELVKVLAEEAALAERRKRTPLTSSTAAKGETP